MCVSLAHSVTRRLNGRIKRSKVQVHLRTFTQDALHVFVLYACGFVVVSVVFFQMLMILINNVNLNSYIGNPPQP